MDSKEWSWCMEYCKKRNNAPANPYLWQQAKDAYREYISGVAK
jgi:hypothetical protein